MKNLCIIPARGGSKRIPRKNVKPFLGKPILAYSIVAAKESGLFDEIMVSTDDMEIAEVAKQYGANVPFLRSELTANDFAPLASVIDEVIHNYSCQGVIYDNFCCILATAPFVTPHLLRETYISFVEKQFDSLRPITLFEYPIQRAFRVEENDAVSFMFPDFVSARSQDLEKAYHDTGLFYWGICSKGLRGEFRGGYIIDSNICQDIDTLDDWKIAEMKFKIMHRM